MNKTLRRALGIATLIGSIAFAATVLRANLAMGRNSTRPVPQSLVKPVALKIAMSQVAIESLWDEGEFTHALICYSVPDIEDAGSYQPNSVELIADGKSLTPYDTAVHSLEFARNGRKLSAEEFVTEAGSTYAAQFRGPSNRCDVIRFKGAIGASERSLLIGKFGLSVENESTTCEQIRARLSKTNVKGSLNCFQGVQSFGWQIDDAITGTRDDAQTTIARDIVLSRSPQVARVELLPMDR